jgi:aryl-alcohol dehydrogenase-like predicted oxidoreductase
MLINRRRFLQTSLAGLSSLFVQNGRAADVNPFAMVPLGKTGLQVSRIAFGTGVKSINRQSNLTRQGMDAAKILLRYAYDKGVRFFDCADTYGTHAYVAAGLHGIPRDRYVLSSKLWFRPGGIPEPERPDADIAVDRFRKELDTDYIDIVQLHCMYEPNWPDIFRRQMDILENLKAKKIIRAHGVSVHSLEALYASIDEPWVDVIHVRLNPEGIKMDSPEPAPVIEAIEKLHQAGKGVIAMKLVGEGKYRTLPEKIDASLRMALNVKKVDVLLVGFDTPAQVDDMGQRVGNILKA